MALTTELAPEMLAACRAGAVAAGEALSRAFENTISLTPGDALSLDATRLPPELAGAGLLVVLNIGSAAAVLVIPQTAGLAPAWCAAPDNAGANRLANLARELGPLLLPAGTVPYSSAALWVENVPAALLRGKLASTSAAIPLELSVDGKPARATLIWPVQNPGALAPRSEGPLTGAPLAAPPGEDLEAALPALPNYTRSLLKIEVPIVVTLARSKQPLSRIVELAPGSIIPFDKSCEDTLVLEVNNREVAAGEAVKVGDKFGLRITSMVMPPERFLKLRGRR